MLPQILNLTTKKIKMKNKIIRLFGDSKILVVVFLSLLCASFYSFYYNIPFLSWIIVILLNTYLVYVVFYASIKSDSHKGENWFWGKVIPNRFSGVIVFVCIYLCIILGFSEILLAEEAPNCNTKECAFFKSFISLTSFSFDNYDGQTWHLQKIQMWHSFNGLLLLTATFGFLISRISNFKEKISLEKLDQKIDLLKRSEEDKIKIEKLHQFLNENQNLTSEVRELKLKIENLKNSNN
ncbi:MAG: hypothetical protein BGO42_04275 [Flavobacterium sp. 40-81]|nr:MAG: hypothetical protein BGO42_04275 [Flavobacterium sp. 40-81]